MSHEWEVFLNSLAQIGVSNPDACLCNLDYSRDFPDDNDRAMYPELVWLHENHRYFNSIVYDYMFDVSYEAERITCLPVKSDEDDPFHEFVTTANRVLDLDYMRDEPVMYISLNSALRRNFFSIHNGYPAPNKSWADDAESYWAPEPDEDRDTFCRRAHESDLEYQDSIPRHEQTNKEISALLELSLRRLNTEPAVDPQAGNGNVLFF